jgi:hypothetical protein
MLYVRFVSRYIGILGVALLAIGSSPAIAPAACGQLTTCNAGNMCFWKGDNQTGTPILNVAGSNPTLDFTGCPAFNDLTQSAKNNATSTSDHYRLYETVNYAGSTLCLAKGDTVSGSTGMGVLYQHVEAVKKTNGCP